MAINKKKKRKDDLETVKATLIVWWVALVCLMGICFVSVLHAQNETERKKDITSLTVLSKEEGKNYGNSEHPVYVNKYKADEEGNYYNFYTINPNSDITEKEVYSNKERIDDDGILSILKNGQYLPNSIKEEDKKAIIQLAIWIYKGYLDKDEKEAVLNNYLSSYIRLLLKKAKNEEYNQSSVELSTETPSISLSNDKNYYMSDLISLEFSNQVTVVDYSINLKEAPKGTKIIDKNGKKVDDITKVTEFYLKIPEENVNEDNKHFSISVDVVTSDYFAYAFSKTTNYSDEANIIVDTLKVSFNHTKNTMELNVPKEVKYSIFNDRTLTGIFLLCLTATICAAGILCISVYQNNQKTKKKKRKRKKR